MEEEVIQDFTVDLVLGGVNASPIAARDQPRATSEAARVLRAVPTNPLK